MPYLNVNEVESALTAAETLHPSLVHRVALPHQTWESRTCHAVEIAKGSAQNRIGVYLVGGIHAREWVCPDTLISFTEKLTQAYESNSGIILGGKSFTATQIKSIVEKLDLWVFPQANPDGRHHSLTSDTWWRKNRRPAPPGNPGDVGVDLNRNYDFLWNYLNYFHPAAPVMNSTDPGDDTYIGPNALSEPETKNVVWLLDQHPNIRFLVDVHSYSELILYNWGDDDNQTSDPNMNFHNASYDTKRGIGGDTAYKEYVPSDDQNLEISLANRMRGAIQAVRGRTYTVQQSFGLYPTAGTSTDFTFGRYFTNGDERKVHSYTVECGTTFFPSDSERVQIMNEVTAGLIEFCLGVLELPCDVYLRDNLSDRGEEPLVGGGISQSPDIHHFRSPLTDPQATLGSEAAKARDDLFEDVELGQPNYLYARLQNRGYEAASADVDLYWTPVSTLPTPASWNLIGTLHATSIDPGELQVAGPLVWNTVPAKGHYCFIAVAGAADDPKPSLSAVSDINDFYALIRESNNVTWKNFNVQDMFAGSQYTMNFHVQGWRRIAYASDLELDLSELPRGTEAELRILNRLADGARLEGLARTKRTAYHSTFRLRSSSLESALRRMPLQTSDDSQARLMITLPETAPDGVYNLAILQRIDGREMGRVTQRLVVGDHPYVGNRHTHELHVAGCEWVGRMNPTNRVAHREIEWPLRQGYNGCHYCLPEYDDD